MEKGLKSHYIDNLFLLPLNQKESHQNPGKSTGDQSDFLSAFLNRSYPAQIPRTTIKEPKLLLCTLTYTKHSTLIIIHHHDNLVKQR